MAERNVDSATDADLSRLASVDLNLLVPLLALLEERSVTRAARKVGLSQPAMSHGLNRTRRLLNDELLVRQGRGMVLTPRAAELIVPLRQALHQAATIVTGTSFDPAVDRRLITVAMTNSTAFVIGSELSRLLAERAPNTVLRLRTTSVTTSAAFAEDAADVVLLPEAFPTPHPRERLYDDRWVVVASWNEPKDADALELLEKVPHVFLDEPAERQRPYEILDEKKIQYRVRQRVSDYLFIPHLIAQSGGGVAIHRYQVGLEFEGRFDLRVEEFPFPIEALGIDMVWNPWLADGPFKTWLREMLIEAAEPLRARYLPPG
ncbi:LysR family transcriptional regulator [Arthrobacter mangrovi]|uniref:Nodulation protein D 1 n=1 Tax=Arthrobacter mangrovi TaxID=2966350 RepID=A0ABQ5MVJ7_9MICC|nr:LysR family transcriptional regulator [Arthrobacter mangrovi]GLB67964.1 nodulation protein D 1 [Arthrobacter mangrovi]